MGLRRAPANEYDGLATFDADCVWRVWIGIGRGNDWRRLNASALFNSDELAKRLRDAGIDIKDVAFDQRGARCEISTAAGRSTRSEGRILMRVLKKYYSTYQGTKVHWNWTFEQD